LLRSRLPNCVGALQSVFIIIKFFIHSLLFWIFTLLSQGYSAKDGQKLQISLKINPFKR